jgi:hypothetical protein
MKILLGYSHYPYAFNVGAWYEAWLARLRAQGIQVDGFCLTLDPPAPRLGWANLESLWRRGDKELFKMYENLSRRLEEYDVFINFNGINLHPDFVLQLPTFNVYGCFDDPESSEDLSRPVAWAYDLAMVGNAAAVETYRQWGVREVRFWPLGFRVDDYDPSLTREDIITGKRDLDVALLCERTTSWRKDRLDRFAAAFPQGAYFGNGWPKGFLPEEQRIPLYKRCKIGINFHNSTGPINFRTYILPANGIMQMCDNKSHLGEIYQLDKEVVGFDTVEEAIERCRYYLEHDEERRHIAAAGRERALRDYNEVAVFKLVTNYVKQLQPAFRSRQDNAVIYLRSQRAKKIARRVTNKIRRTFFAESGRA